MSRDLQKYKTYYLLVLILAAFSVVRVYLPQGDQIPKEALEMRQSVLVLVNLGIMLLIYGPLGYIGLKLSDKVNLPTTEKVDAMTWLKKTTIIGFS